MKGCELRSEGYPLCSCFVTTTGFLSASKTTLNRPKPYTLSPSQDPLIWLPVCLSLAVWFRPRVLGFRLAASLGLKVVGGRVGDKVWDLRVFRYFRFGH